MITNFVFDKVKIEKKTVSYGDFGVGGGRGGGGGGVGGGRQRVSEQLHVLWALMTGKHQDGRPWSSIAFSHPIVCICHDNQR